MNERDTWPLILEEEHRHMVFDNTVLRKVTGQQRDGVRGTAENYISGASRSVLLIKNDPGNQIKNDEMGQACGTYGRDANRVWVGNSVGMTSLGRPRSRQENNIKTYLQFG